MGLTFRKRDDFGKTMEDLGIQIDLDQKLVGEVDETSKVEKNEDPFAKFLAPQENQEQKETEE